MLLHGDDFVEEILTREEVFRKCAVPEMRGKKHGEVPCGWQHFLTSFFVIRNGGLYEARCNGASISGIGKVVSSCDSVAKRPKSEELLLPAGANL